MSPIPTKKFHMTSILPWNNGTCKRMTSCCFYFFARNIDRKMTWRHAYMMSTNLNSPNTPTLVGPPLYVTFLSILVSTCSLLASAYKKSKHFLGTIPYSFLSHWIRLSRRLRGPPCPACFLCYLIRALFPNFARPSDKQLASRASITEIYRVFALQPFLRAGLLHSSPFHIIV